MTTTFWIVQSLGIIAVILTCFSFFQKEKWKMMAFLMATNIIFIATCFLCERFLGSLLVVGAFFRTLVYFLYSKHNKQPEPLVMILFELYTIGLSIFLWNGYVDILMIANLVIVSYTTWQNNISIIRFGYMISSLLLIAYDILIGAYTTAVSEVIMLISVCYALIKYAETTTTTKSKTIPQKWFLANKHFWQTNLTPQNDFDVVCCGVDKHPFYNLAILKNFDINKEVLENVQKLCKKQNITPALYVSYSDKKINSQSKLANTMSLFFKIKFHDVWMKLIDGYNLNNTNCKINDVSFCEIGKEQLKDIASLYFEAYEEKQMSPEDKPKQQNILNLKLNETIDGYTINGFVAYFGEEPIAMCLALSNKVECFITKVATLPKFRRKHVASSLLQFCITKQRKKGVQDFFICTDKNTTKEQFYAYNSFKEFAQGMCFDISKKTEIQNFLNKQI